MSRNEEVVRSGARAKRGRRGQPRLNTTIDDVTVVEPFSLYFNDNETMRNGTDGHESGFSGTTKSSATCSSGGTREKVGDLNTAAAAPPSIAASGDGCYVSAILQNRKYYGVLFDQDALKAASGLYFQNESSSLDLNQRIMTLDKERRQQEQGRSIGSTAEFDSMVPVVKRQKMSAPGSDEATTSPATSQVNDVDAVQKFRFVIDSLPNHDGAGGEPTSGYHELVATFINVGESSESDAERARIREACASGGNFVGRYYYQYEKPDKTMHACSNKHGRQRQKRSYRLSLGMDNFLRSTPLPEWYPLAQIDMRQSKTMNMLQMKSNHKGEITVSAETSKGVQDTMVPMKARSRLRVGIVGGGIAGLACAHEILRLSKTTEEQLEIEVVLLEARSRVGGRLLTDKDTFKSSDGSTPFPVDLGASWIHGITDNPLTALSREAGIDLFTSIEEVKMLGANMKEVDHTTDQKMGDLFDALLDKGADDCWKREEMGYSEKAPQKACRWYGSVLTSSHAQRSDVHREIPLRNPPSKHRETLDITIDNAIGAAMKGRAEFEHLTDQERNLLLWYAKNAEYALGADLKDLSMMYWDSDETHAFGGDHVLLKQGYSTLVEHILKKCESFGDCFKILKDCPIGKIEFARNSTSHPYRQKESSIKRIDLSDTCSVESKDGTWRLGFDFVVSAVPLGVLKDSINPRKLESPLTFEPSLPHSKTAAIENVGFGLLNKVYLQFPSAFWRKPGIKSSLSGTPFLGHDSMIFGNASGLNPQHYMFLDIGKMLSDRDESEPPAILVTLISGSRAVAAEQMSDEAQTNEVMATLRKLFSVIDIPSPIQTKITRWGSDQYARGCYTFLPPGTSDEDYHILQSPVNGKGEAFVLSKSETMRLFFCGEHTTSLHPSMAHGAYLSGLRTAKDIINATYLPATDVRDFEIEERPIPLSYYRQKVPKAPLQCNLCSLSGNRKKEGALLAFQRGSRRVMVHTNCAAMSPEVSLDIGKWRNVFRAINRGKKLACVFCGKEGATIGCTFGVDSCLLSYHFRCAEATGWSFERDGKAFLCDEHRFQGQQWNELRQTSVEHYLRRYPGKSAICCLCKNNSHVERKGELLAFRQGRSEVLVHAKCLRCTSSVRTFVDYDESESIDDDGGDHHGKGDMYQNVFAAIESSKECEICKCEGATLKCSFATCLRQFHLVCAEDSTAWSFHNRGMAFVCGFHGGADEAMSFNEGTKIDLSVPDDVALEGTQKPAASITDADSPPTTPVLALLKHDLFCKGSATVDRNGSVPGHRAPRKRNYQPANEYVYRATKYGDVREPGFLSKIVGDKKGPHATKRNTEEVKASSFFVDILGKRLMANPHLVGSANFGCWGRIPIIAKRSSLSVPWGMDISVAEICTASNSAIHVLESARDKEKQRHGLERGDIIVKMNEATVGSDKLPNFVCVMQLMKASVELRLEVLRS